MRTTELTAEELSGIRAKLADRGQTLKIRYIDKDPAKGLLGVRLTNAGKLIEDAWSIQVLDRSSVSIAIGGLDNDHHISATEDDGAAIVEALRDGGYLPDELWDIIPDGKSKAASPGPINDEKAHLIMWLADKYPAQFGAYGTATNAPDFYGAVMNLLRTVDADYRTRRDYDSIVEMEAAARRAYQYASRQLMAVSQAADENMRQEHRIAALNLLYSAAGGRDAAINIRARLSADGHAVPPAAEFPEIPEVTADALRDRIIDASLYEVPSRGRDNENAAADVRNPISTPRTNDLNDGRPLLTGPADVERGAMVVVANRNTPQFSQMGTVVETFAEYATVKFSANAPTALINYSDLVKP